MRCLNWLLKCFNKSSYNNPKLTLVKPTDSMSCTDEIERLREELATLRDAYVPLQDEVLTLRRDKGALQILLDYASRDCVFQHEVLDRIQGFVQWGRSNLFPSFTEKENIVGDKSGVFCSFYKAFQLLRQLPELEVRFKSLDKELLGVSLVGVNHGIVKGQFGCQEANMWRLLRLQMEHPDYPVYFLDRRVDHNDTSVLDMWCIELDEVYIDNGLYTDSKSELFFKSSDMETLTTFVKNVDMLVTEEEIAQRVFELTFIPCIVVSFE